MGNIQVLKSTAEPDGMRVFVAANNALEIFWLEMVFKGARIPYNIEIASDGPTANEYLDQVLIKNRPAPDLILLDANLPAAPTQKMLDELASVSSAPLFLMVSEDAHCGLGNVRDGIGGRRCLHKPFTHSHLQSCLAAGASSRVQNLPGRF